MRLLEAVVDALPKRLWRPGNFYKLPGGGWHCCVGADPRLATSVRTVEWRGREVARGRRPFAFSAHGCAEATVVFWRAEGGWGAIRAADRPGIGFVHFSHVRGVDGYRALNKGERVRYEWADDLRQDDCDWRVEWVERIGGRS